MKSIRFCQTTTARKQPKARGSEVSSNLSQILVCLLQPNSPDWLGLFSLGESTPTWVLESSQSTRFMFTMRTQLLPLYGH